MAKIYCSNCGQLIPEDSNFCRICGAPQHGPESALFRAEAAPVEQATKPIPEVLSKKYARMRRLERETVARRQLDPKAVWLFFINYNLFMFILIPAFAAAIYFQPLVVILFFAYELMVFLIASLVHNHFYFEIDDNGLEIEYGIIHKKHVSLPFRQIQNVNVIRTFIDRLLGIAKLEVETAGSARIKKRDVIGGVRTHAEAILPGLSLKDSRHLHDLLLQKKEMHHRNGD